MIDAYLLYEVTFFSYSAKIKHDISKLPKLYTLDNGLINVVSVKYSKNRGQMFENTVLIKLLESYEDISYWSELNSEVDFIADNKAINATAADKIPEREMQGLDNFRKKHKEFSSLIIAESAGEDKLSLLDFLRKSLS